MFLVANSLIGKMWILVIIAGSDPIVSPLMSANGVQTQMMVGKQCLGTLKALSSVKSVRAFCVRPDGENITWVRGKKKPKEQAL